MTRPKDLQKSRVYNSEHFDQRSPASVRFLMQGKKYSTGNVHIEACQAYVDDLLGRAWFVRRWGAGWMVAVVQKSGGNAYGSFRGHRRGRITLPVFARTEPVILHELAHVLTNQNPTLAAHGPEFCGVYLELVRYAVGKEAAAQVRAQFKAKPVVRWNRKMVPSPSQAVWEQQAAKRS